MNRSEPPGRVLIVGATSGLARAIAGRLAQEGHDLVLAARDEEETGFIASDLRLRYGVDAVVEPFDALDFDRHASLFEAPGTIDAVVVCHGYLVPQDTAQDSFDESRKMIDVNFTSYVSILNRAAEFFETKRRGVICALSSVAGDRGRPSNYIYGSTKAAITAYLQGLRARMAKAGVHVVTVKPGLIDTAMTWGLAGAAGPAGSPQRVGRDVCRAIEKRRNVVYTPWIYRPIMTIIRLIPEMIFKRLKL